MTTPDVREWINTTLGEGEAPAAPANLREGGVTAERIEVRWEENATNEDQLIIVAAVAGTDLLL